MALTTTVRTPWPQPVAASMPLFSSSGCATACISTAVVFNCRSSSPRPTSPFIAEMGGICARIGGAGRERDGQGDNQNNSTSYHCDYLGVTGAAGSQSQR